MHGIRVLRILEYTYVDAETAANDMKHWTHGRFGHSMTMKSATLPFETIEFIEPDIETDGFHNATDT